MGFELYRRTVAPGQSASKATPERLLIRQLDTRMPFGKVLVAIANKNVRQLWAMLAHDLDYDPHACVKHPMAKRSTTAHADSATTMV